MLLTPNCLFFKVLLLDLYGFRYLEGQLRLVLVLIRLIVVGIVWDLWLG